MWCNVGGIIVSAIYHELIGKLRWHLKDAPTPQPALMICNHAGECAVNCYEKTPHPESSVCSIVPRFGFVICPFPKSVCVPWVRAQDEPEPVKHTSCKGCGNKRHTKPFDYETECSKTLQVCIDCYGWMNPNGLRKHYTPKEPEPVAKENFTAVEPKAEPGLIGCKIIGGKGNELWIVDMPWGNSIALYKAIGRKDFSHISTKQGSITTTLQGFHPDDPPVRAWFRKQ